MDDEPTGILIIYSSIAMGCIGDSYSLEISMALRSLSMIHASNLKMHLTNLTYNTTTHSTAHTTLYNPFSASHSAISAE